VDIDATLYGISMRGWPNEAMQTFIHEWGAARGKDVVDRIVENTDL